MAFLLAVDEADDPSVDGVPMDTPADEVADPRVAGMSLHTSADGSMKVIVQKIGPEADGSIPTPEDILESLIVGLCESIDQRPEERAEGWLPSMPSESDEG